MESDDNIKAESDDNVKTELSPPMNQNATDINTKKQVSTTESNQTPTLAM